MELYRFDRGMQRALPAALLVVALATLAALRAGGEEPVNPLRSSEPISQSPYDFGAILAGYEEESAEPLELATGEATEPNAAQAPPPLPAMPQPGHWHEYHDEALPPTPTELMWFHCLARAWSPHRHPNDPQRHYGVGEPLIGTSWRNRPLYVSLFAGGLLGDDLQEGEVEQGGGFIAGGRFGGDFDHYWGLETRLAFSDLHVNYPGETESGESSNSYFDASVLYYPWGDTRWRPYLTVGFGVANYKYADEDALDIRVTAVEVPWGGGLKYLLTRNVAIRFDLIDNFSFPAGSRADTMHNFSFTGGAEIHFGGRQTGYGW